MLNFILFSIYFHAFKANVEEENSYIAWFLYNLKPTRITKSSSFCKSVINPEIPEFFCLKIASGKSFNFYFWWLSKEYVMDCFSQPAIIDRSLYDDLHVSSYESCSLFWWNLSLRFYVLWKTAHHVGAFLKKNKNEKNKQNKIVALHKQECTVKNNNLFLFENGWK